MEPRRRPPREQRLGCGRSVGGRGGGSAERGPREASCESGGSRRLRPRSPGCCVGEAAPGSRYGGGSGPRPAVGRAGSTAAAGGARGRAGRDRDLGTCQQGAVRARAGACGGAGWLAPPGSPSAERVRALGKPGAWVGCREVSGRARPGRRQRPRRAAKWKTWPTTVRPLRASCRPAPGGSGVCASPSREVRAGGALWLRVSVPVAQVVYLREKGNFKISPSSLENYL